MFELDPAETIPDGIARVLDYLFDDAEARLAQLDAADPAHVVDGVHQFRKRSKELRSVARLVRPTLGPAFGRFNGLVREASLQLSAPRDAHVMLQTFDRLLVEIGGQPDGALDDQLHPAQSFAALRAHLAATSDAATGALQRGDVPRDEAGRLVATARDEAASWQLPDCTTPLAEGLEQTFRRGRRARRAAGKQPTDERLHELRKSVKNLRYQTQLLAASPSAEITALIEELDALGDLIGEDHDLAVLIDHVGRMGVGTDVAGPARARQHELRNQALTRSEPIYAEAGESFVARLMAGWIEATDHARR